MPVPQMPQMPAALQGLMAGGQSAPQAAPPPNPDTDPNNPDYEPPESGPFRCDNCTFYTDPNQCTQQQVLQVQKGVVDPAGCCKFFSTLTPAQGDQNIKPYGK
jgi:hypothetical protein